MAYIENRAWQLAFTYEKLSGFWPYQSKVKNYILRFLSSSLLILIGFGLGNRLVEDWNKDLDVVIENVMVLLVAFCLFIKIVTVSFVDDMRREIFDQVFKHFNIIIEKDEIELLNAYANEGLMFSIRGLAAICLAVGVFLGAPITREIFLYFFGNGKKLKKQLPIFADYMVDENEYFYHILASIFMALIDGGIAQISFDLNFFLTVRHVGAICDIVKYRLKKASEIFENCGWNNELENSEEKEAFLIITSAVDLHNEAIKLTQKLDEAYKGCWFIVLLANTIGIAPVPVLVLLYLHDSFELFRHSMSFVIFIVHFYIIFVQGQLTIDYSSSVFEACYDFCWYKASKRSQAAISIMMYRSLTPCRLTGGNMFYLSMETYSNMLKTAVSYISMFMAVFL